MASIAAGAAPGRHPLLTDPVAHAAELCRGALDAAGSRSPLAGRLLVEAATAALPVLEALLVERRERSA
jgi:hypothetical protein